ncbi:MAG: ABC transporter permease subunit [Clostridiales bacterium]|jgi:ABC-2 type transport system permease protein|nr:ABC transporter permease subunit [Clostridiales bacterium]
MGAIFKKEFKSFFTSPVGYFVLALILALSGYFFTGYNLVGGSSELSGVYGSVFSLVLVLVLPILTMRLFSDEKRQRTDQALLTSPVSLTSITLGKFFAALLMFAIGMSITLVFSLIIAFQVTPDWMVIIGNYLGMMLMGGMVIAIGLLISCLTESQIIAALGTAATAFVLTMLDSLSYMFSSNKILTDVIGFLSVTGRYNDFTTGIINYDNIIFFLSFQALFLFLTVRVLDHKRWS